jgi:hypothetical protein
VRVKVYISIDTFQRQLTRIHIIILLVDRVLAVADMWQRRFPVTVFVWGQRSTEYLEESLSDPQQAGEAVTVLMSPNKTSWVRGIELAVQAVRQKNGCEYIFTHDDDLVAFSTTLSLQYN